MVSELHATVEELGGAPILGRSLRTPTDIQPALRAGSPQGAVDRLYRLARIVALAKHYLGDGQAAHAWLRRPNRALGGAVPLDLLDTEPGARAVENVLGRIAYGGVS